MWVIVLIMLVIFGIQYKKQWLESDELEFRVELEKFNYVSRAVQKMSDDLTNMSRMYVFTGDEKYKRIYERIIDIRDGHVDLPNHYHLYLTEIEADSEHEPDVIEGINIDSYYADMDKSYNEILLKKARLVSVALSEIELSAFDLLEKGNQEGARKLLLDSQYLSIKQKVSQSIESSKVLIDEQLTTFLISKQKQQLWLTILTYFIIASTIVFVVTYNKKIRHIVTFPVKSLDKWGKKVAIGNYKEELNVEVPIELKELKSTMGILANNTDALVTRLQHIANIDDLTNLPNRRAATEYLIKKQQEVTRYEIDCSMMILDIDYFKKVNDTYGHQVGDDVLANLADLVSKQLRSVDFFARLGGEEFIIVMPQCNVNSAYLLAEKIRKVAEKHVYQSITDRMPVTITCGIAALLPKRDVDQSYREADQALYKGKKLGRNNVQVYTDTTQAA